MCRTGDWVGGATGDLQAVKKLQLPGTEPLSPTHHPVARSLSKKIKFLIFHHRLINGANGSLGN